MLHAYHKILQNNKRELLMLQQLKWISEELWGVQKPVSKRYRLHDSTKKS